MSGAATASFLYDGDGARVKGTVGGVTTYYPNQFYEVAGGTVKKYYYACAQRVALNDGGATRVLLGDHLGSTAVTVAGTTELGDVRYKAFGASRFTSGTTPTTFRYTGQREESSFGLYYYGARWYDPALGHFIQPDTIIPQPGNVLDYHRYAYVRFNPLRYNDPSGHEVAPCDPSFCGVEILNYSNTSGLANTAIDAVTWLGCMVVGCVADFNTDTVRTPTQAEALDSLVMGAVAPLQSGKFVALADDATRLALPGRIVQGELSDDLASTFAGGRYASVILETDVVLYRAGKTDAPLGQFFSQDAPISEIQTRIDKAILPQWPGGQSSPLDTVYAVKIPAGTTVHVGQVGYQHGFYMGGTEQIVVEKPWTIAGVQVIDSWPIYK